MVVPELVDLGAQGVDGAAAHGTAHAAHGQPSTSELRTVGTGSLAREEHSEVARDGVEPARRDDPGPGAPGGLVVRGDHAVDEDHLAGDVAVVGPRLCAGSHQGGPVLDVGPHRRRHDPSTCREAADGVLVHGVDDHQRPLRGGVTEVAGEGLQAAQRATGERDAHVGSCRCGEVSSRGRPRGSGRAEQDDVELSGVGAHPVTLGRRASGWFDAAVRLARTKTSVRGEVLRAGGAQGTTTTLCAVLSERSVSRARP